MAGTNRIMELQQELLALRISDWQEKVFSLQWFFIIFLIVVPWITWWKLVNKKYIAEILSFGLLIMVTASLLNEVGLQLQLWRSPYSLLPVPHRWFAPAYSYLPVTFMLIYQYSRTWKSFTIMTVALSAITAFVFQPILTWLGIHIFIKWNYFYSFLTLIAEGLGMRLLHQVILQRKPMIIETVDNISNDNKFNLASPVFKKLTKR